ncbi:MAG: hypothetical protein ACRDIB_13045 [Ardenticatenaceae bacterium]
MLRGLVGQAGIFLLALLVTGCSFVMAGAPTPEAAARLNSEERGFINFRVVATRDAPDGMIVFYTHHHPGGVEPGLGFTRPVDMFGYAVAERVPLGWRVNQAASSSASEVGEESLVHLGISGSAGNTTVYGRTTALGVAAVEAHFLDGPILRDETGDGVFRLVADNDSTLCFLRLFDEEGQQLERRAFSRAPACAAPADETDREAS